MLRPLCLAIATLLSVTTIQANGPQRRVPRLVVGILVEGLNRSDIDACRNSFSDTGLKRLIEQGLTVDALQYPSGTTRESAAAILMTGAMPSVNGITGPSYYDRSAMRAFPSMHDAAYMGNSTTETLSPAPLRVTTVADELRIATDGHSRIYSVSADAPTALISSGHLGTSALWINDKDGRWCSSTYYKEFPSFVASYNYKQPLSARLDTITWSCQQTASNGVKPFKYYYPQRDHTRYSAFKASPRGNDEVTSLAIDIINRILAKDNKNGASDMLTVGLTVAQYPYSTSSSTINIERDDAYQRLDTQISRLLAAIESTVGLDNAMIYIAGVPAPDLERRAGSNWKIPGGEFSPRRARALLNMHLTALYGSGEWVTGYHRRHFYLNNKLAEEKGLTPQALHATAATFLSRMSGINRAVTIDRLLNSDEASGLDLTTAGDVIIDINPGWTMIETDDHSIDGRSVRLAAPYAPFYLLSPGVSSTTINTPVDARRIAPTLSGALRIRSPNAAILPSLPL